MPNLDIVLTLKFGEQLFADSRRICLLKAISQTGSLSQAAKSIGISYKTAWDSINEINQLADTPFVKTSTGGKGGGGAELSQYAQRFIELYDSLTTIQRNAFDILKDETIPLNDVFKVAATLSLQSSARNQLYGTIKSIHAREVAGFITVLLQDQKTEFTVYITHSSIERLNLTIGKNVLLMIKAPQVELIPTANQNIHVATVKNIKLSKNWCELALMLSPDITIYASRPITELATLHIKQGDKINIYIHSENIIIATVI